MFRKNIEDGLGIVGDGHKIVEDGLEIVGDGHKIVEDGLENSWRWS